MMTDSTNHLAQGSDSAVERQRHLRRLAHELENGLPVYDLNGERVGDVKEYNAVAGYLQVSAGVFGQQELYLPIRLLADIWAREIHLVAPQDALAAQYRQPPAIVTLVENHGDPGATTSRMSGAREVQLIANGYDGAMTEISAVELSSVAERLSVGLTVYDVDGVRIGEISEYDANRRVLVIESGIMTPKYRVAPFSAIGAINRHAQAVHLTVREVTLHKTHGLVSGDWPPGEP
jgi:sporulation protein YlmC with PRC-barrel domain